MSSDPFREFRRWRKYHTYFRRTGFYQFILVNLLKVFAVLAFLIVLFLVMQKYIIEYRPVVDSWLQGLNWLFVFAVFFASESLLGLVPPDFFILWANQFIYPYLAVAVLAMLSYSGGLVSYYIGTAINRNEYVRNFLSWRYTKLFRLIKQWGGLFVVAAALFPIPYSMVCLLVGVVRFPTRRFLLYSLTRFLRFFIWAFILFTLVR